MNLKEFLLENEFWQEDCPGVLQTSVLLSNVFIRQNKHLGRDAQSSIVLAGREDYLWEISLVKDKQAIFNIIAGKGYDFLAKKTTEWNREREILEEFILNLSTRIVGLTDAELADTYIRFFEMASENWSYPIMGEGLDLFSTYELIPLIMNRLSVPAAEARGTAITLSQSKVKSFLDEEKLSLLRIAIGKGNLDEHIRKYYWIADNYCRKAELGRKYFEDEADAIRKKSSKEEILERIARSESYEQDTHDKKEAIILKYHIDGELLNIFRILEHMSWWIDQRKIMMLKIFHMLFTILEEAEKRFGLEEHSTKYYMPAEVISLIREKKKVDWRKRRKGYVYFLDSEFKDRLIEGEEASLLIDAYLNKTTSEEIKGVTASTGKGNVKARVCIIRDVARDKFEPGAILVASMTRPEFVPLMRKAAAIVTDEGGITCHAAIVSRELGIPCIIGTKNATKNLRNGELVELDIENGIVRRLK